MNVAIVDDEPLARSRLRRMLTAQGVDVIAEGETGKDAVQIASDELVDLIFLDISMPIKNGLQAAAEIEELIVTPPAIVFCTAYDQFAIQAFKTNAVAYLLKPFSSDDLVDALEKASRVSRTQLDSITATKEPYAKISLKVGNGAQLVGLSDISHFYSEDKYVFANIRGQAPVFVDKSLKQLECEYPIGFIRCHRNSLVNKQHIEKIFRNESGQAYIQLIDSGECIAVSRRHYAEVKKCFQ